MSTRASDEARKIRDGSQSSRASKFCQVVCRLHSLQHVVSDVALKARKQTAYSDKHDLYEKCICLGYSLKVLFINTFQVFRKETSINGTPPIKGFFSWFLQNTHIIFAIITSIKGTLLLVLAAKRSYNLCNYHLYQGNTSIKGTLLLVPAGKTLI